MEILGLLIYFVLQVLLIWYLVDKIIDRISELRGGNKK